MSDGYIETGEDVLLFIKQTGLTDGDREAIDAMEKGIVDIVKTINDLRMPPKRKIRIGYCAGILAGMKIIATMSQLKLKQMRFEAGKDPETGEPMKSVEA